VKKLPLISGREAVKAMSKIRYSKDVDILLIEFLDKPIDHEVTVS